MVEKNICTGSVFQLEPGKTYNMISSILYLPHASRHILLFQEPQPMIEHKQCQSSSSEHIMQPRKNVPPPFFSALPGIISIHVFNSVTSVPFQSSSGTSVSTQVIVFQRPLCLLTCTANSLLICSWKISGCPFSGLNLGSACVDKATRPSIRWISGVSRIRNRLVKIIDFIVNEKK